jgi:beta-lactam-binding protein with PASTA domain
MKNIFLFLKSKQFRIHFVISVVVAGIIFWASFKSLGSYTHHGITIAVSDFSNIKTEDLNKFISDKQLRYEVIDSIFDSKVAAGVVIKQDPEKNIAVKQNRIIYLTVSAKLPPLIKMPNLVDASMRQAQAMIESDGLKVGTREYRSDPCVNCVLAQMMKGKKIDAGTMIPKGSVIDLILGKGEKDEKINIPCLIGLSQKDALNKITENGLSEGTIKCIDCKTSADKENAKVYKQTPSCSSNAMINFGNAIDLFISVKAKVISPTDTIGNE